MKTNNQSAVGCTTNHWWRGKGRMKKKRKVTATHSGIPSLFTPAGAVTSPLTWTHMSTIQLPKSCQDPCPAQYQLPSSQHSGICLPTYRAKSLILSAHGLSPVISLSVSLPVISSIPTKSNHQLIKISYYSQSPVQRLPKSA